MAVEELNSTIPENDSEAVEELHTPTQEKANEALYLLRDIGITDPLGKALGILGQDAAKRRNQSDLRPFGIQVAETMLNQAVQMIRAAEKVLAKVESGNAE